MQDPDVPLLRPITHLIATNIVGTELEPGALSPVCSDDILSGRNTLGGIGYTGPRPIPGHGKHRYVFQLYALDRLLPPDARLRPAIIEAALATGALTGCYQRS